MLFVPSDASTLSRILPNVVNIGVDRDYLEHPERI